MLDSSNYLKTSGQDQKPDRIEMRRSQRYCANLIIAFIALLVGPLDGRVWAQGEPLKLLISVEQQSIVAPYPARITLHLHNSGKETLWLYRRARPAPLPGAESQMEAAAALAQPGATTGGSTLQIKLIPTNATTVGQASAEAFDNVGLPQPSLVRLDPGDDYEEKIGVKFFPPDSGPDKKKFQIWGRYRLTVTYAARYSNAAELMRILGATLWQGEVTSNTIDVDIEPPPPAATGSVYGSVTDSGSAPIDNALITLTDENDRWVGQATTDRDGKYSFAQLPLGLYWLTVRQLNSLYDTTLFRHVTLTPSDPDGTLDFALYSPELHDPKQLLHKPVLFRVTDSAGRPLAKVKVEAILTSGEILDNVKGETAEDGFLALALIPGRNFVSLKRKGCAEDDERADVAPGGGVDGFGFSFDCAKK